MDATRRQPPTLSLQLLYLAHRGRQLYVHGESLLLEVFQREDNHLHRVGTPEQDLPRAASDTHSTAAMSRDVTGRTLTFQYYFWGYRVMQGYRIYSLFQCCIVFYFIYFVLSHVCMMPYICAIPVISVKIYTFYLFPSIFIYTELI